MFKYIFKAKKRTIMSSKYKKRLKNENEILPNLADVFSLESEDKSDFKLEIKKRFLFLFWRKVYTYFMI